MSDDENERQLLQIYCDESRQTGARYMVFGGVVISDSDLPAYQTRIADFRKQEKWFHPFKCENVATKDIILEKYKRFVDIFFDNPQDIFFKCLFVDRNTMNRNYGTSETRFYTLFYNLLVYSFGKYVESGNPCIITLHRRATNYKISTLKDILNNGMKKVYKCSNSLVRNVQASDLKSSEMLQFADVLMGAVGYELNGYNLVQGASRGKIALMEYIRQRAGLSSFFTNTHSNHHSFSIWHFKYGAGKSKMP
ncbi:MAG: DUF3800 domain-containing protein [Anaerolineales bacterium]